MFGNGKRNDDIQDRAEQIAQETAESLRELRREARGRADDVKKEAVKLLHTAADTIRREARRSGARGDVRESVDDIARGLERAAHYLKRHSYEDMGQDVTESVRRNPWRVLAIVFVVGVLIGLLLRDDSQPSGNGYRNMR